MEAGGEDERPLRTRRRGTGPGEGMGAGDGGRDEENV